MDERLVQSAVAQKSLALVGYCSEEIPHKIRVARQLVRDVLVKEGESAVLDVLGSLLFRHPRLVESFWDYFASGDERARALLKDLAERKPLSCLEFLSNLKLFLSLDELRMLIFVAYEKSPLMTMALFDKYIDLFDHDYFVDLLKSGIDLISDNLYSWLFMLKYSRLLTKELPAELSSYLYSVAEVREHSDMVLGSPRSPGFACGGLEANCHAGCYNGCVTVINDHILAQSSHRKAHADDKVTYWLNKHVIVDGQVYFKDYFYMPSGGQEKLISDSSGKRIYIDRVIFRPARPMIKTESAYLDAMLLERHPSLSVS